jgi:trimethylamine--corrinoid protein Co-methyltransferase
MIVYAEPVSPLTHSDDALRKLLACAELEIPLVYSAYAAMGGTAPMSPAAITVQLCAETLSGLVIHQLKNPGAPFIFGGMASLMDMRTTVFSYGAPEFQRGNTLLAEMAAHFGLPNFGTAGTSDAQTVDGQAIAEAASSCLMAALVGADLIHDVGLLGNATAVSPELIVASDEIIGMARHLLGEVDVGDAALALDVIGEVGPGGEFVTHDHTFDHFRDVWYPALFYRGGAKAWRPGESETFTERVNGRIQELLQTHQPQPLAADAVAAMEQIIAAAVERDGDG